MAESGDHLSFRFPSADGTKDCLPAVFGASSRFCYHPFLCRRKRVRKSGVFFGLYNEMEPLCVCKVVSAYIAMPIGIGVAGLRTSCVFFFDLGQLMLGASIFVIINGFYFAANRASTLAITVFGMAGGCNEQVAVVMVGFDGKTHSLLPPMRIAICDRHTTAKRQTVIFGAVIIELAAAADGSGSSRATVISRGITSCGNATAIDDDRTARRAIPLAGIRATADTGCISSCPLIATAAICGDDAAVDDRRAAGTCLTAADTCRVFTAFCVDDAAVDGDIAGRLAVVTADTCRSVNAGGVQDAHGFFIERLRVDGKATAARYVDTFGRVDGHTGQYNKVDVARDDDARIERYVTVRDVPIAGFIRLGPLLRKVGNERIRIAHTFDKGFGTRIVRRIIERITSDYRNQTSRRNVVRRIAGIVGRSSRDGSRTDHKRCYSAVFVDRRDRRIACRPSDIFIRSVFGKNVRRKPSCDVFFEKRDRGLAHHHFGNGYCGHRHGTLCDFIVGSVIGSSVKSSNGNNGRTLPNGRDNAALVDRCHGGIG